VFYRRIVGLTWKARGGERSTFDGRDATGRFYAHVTNISGPWTIYLAPWACGREGGLSAGRFEDAAEAMAEADRIVPPTSRIRLHKPKTLRNLCCIIRA
jgi:hypothetical protein